MKDKKEPLIPMTDYLTCTPEVKASYDAEVKTHGRITNMKRTMLWDKATYDIYMGWYTLYDELKAFLPERTISLFSYAISYQGQCLICTTFFREILIKAGDDPKDPHLSEEEKLLMDFGRAFVAHPNDIPEDLYAGLKSRYDARQLTEIIGFAGMMVATNLFNDAARVDLDQAIFAYRDKEMLK